jgi:hypothetical protein
MTLPTSRTSLYEEVVIRPRKEGRKEGRNEVLCKCSAMAINAKKKKKKIFFNAFLGTEVSFVNINSTCMK